MHKIVADREHTVCPFCSADKPEFWAEENGWTAVRCSDCGVVYLCPRPPLESIDLSAQTGLHRAEEADGTQSVDIDVTGSFSEMKLRSFGIRMKELFEPEELARENIRWLDIGCGFGELPLALKEIMLPSTIIEGVEPNSEKRKEALRKGLEVGEQLAERLVPYDVISLMNVISHLPDPKSFFASLVAKLKPEGSIVVLTGNGPDYSAEELQIADLGFPDHLIFVEPRHLDSMFAELGMTSVITKEYHSFFIENDKGRILKNMVKTLLGRPTRPAPGDSPYRDFVVRARLKSS